MQKKFTNDYKKSKVALLDQLYDAVRGKVVNKKEFTFFMVHNWIYGRNKNLVLEEEFEKLLRKTGVSENEIELNKVSLEPELA